MTLKQAYFAFVILPLCCSAQSKITSINNPVYCDSSLITIDIKHIELLDNLIEKAKKSQGKAKIEFEREFFCAMPNSNHAMLDLIYLDDIESWKKRQKTGQLPANTGLIHRFVFYFSALESIEPNQYYNKYINICVNGFYGADSNRNGFQIFKRLETDTKAICTVLLQRNEKNIKSVFKFIFDSYHPENEFNKELFEKVYPLINLENKRLGFLFKTSIEDLIKERRH